MACAVAGRGPLSLEDRIGLDEDERRRLDGVVGSQRTLEDVVRWGLALQPPVLISDVLVQDEYTHDVVLPIGAERVLVYDTT